MGSLEFFLHNRGVRTKMAVTTVKVMDMSCGHCVAAIQAAVEKIPGMTGMEANLETKIVTVTFSADSDEGAVMNAVLNAGYTPEALD
jgi:copper chaperone CopZ